jgi:GntR family transcriptional regulator/MocR family aminotransferase
MRRGLRNAQPASLGYGDPRGREELRVELAGYLARVRGVVADPEAIVLCCGFRHGLALVARALRAGGARRLAMEDPCAPPQRAAVEASGLGLASLPVDARGARTDLLDATVDAAVLGPARQFPTGVVLHPDRRAAAIAWATAQRAFVIEDDYDGELRYDRQPVGALQALAPARVVYGGTVSKTLAPGLRLGWLVVPAPLLPRITHLLEAEDAHVSVAVSLAFCELLRSGTYERHVRRARARYRARRDRVLELLARRVPTINAVGISGGLSVLLELPAGSPPAAELVAAGRARSLDLSTLAMFHRADRSPREALVLGYGALAEHDLDAGLEALVRLLGAALPAATNPEEA